MACHAAQYGIIDGIGYLFDGDEAKVAYKDVGYYGDVVIPESVEYEGSTYRVTGIDKEAFIECSEMTSVQIPSSVTSIGYGASLGGIAALLSMLNSCASGVSVVNIDNGFGAGYMASMINHLT